MRKIGETVQPQRVVSSDEEQQKTEHQEAPDANFGGFISASLPVFHLGLSFAQPLAATVTATVSLFSGHMHSMRLGHTLSEDGGATSKVIRGHFRLKSRRVRWYVT